ncbi:hypothetical protein LCGC14_1520370 [marine sediment metagenome]
MSRGYQIIETDNGNQFKLTVELSTEQLAWYVYIDSLKVWHKPKNIPISELERVKIVKKVKTFY